MSVLPYVMRVLSEWMSVYEVIHMVDDDTQPDGSQDVPMPAAPYLASKIYDALSPATITLQNASGGNTSMYTEELN